MLAEVEQLVAAIGCLESCDVADDELHEATIALHRAQARLGLLAGRNLARWESQGVWATDQSRTSTSRLARELNCSTRTAKATLRRARRLTDVPATVEAVRGGVLSPDHIDLLATAHTAALQRFAADEAMLVAQCATLRFPQAEQFVAYWKLHANPDAANGEHEHAASKARAYASETLDGTVIINATLDALGGAAFLAELRRLEQAQRLADDNAGITRTIAERRAAAMVTMALRSAATPKGSRRPRPLFTVLLGDEAVSHLCETAAGRVVPPTALAPYLDAADLQVVLFDGPTTVVGVSRQRSFIGAVRRAIQVRDRHCQHPSGCDVSAEECDVDHIVPYVDGGLTDQFNGRLECSTHNRNADRHDNDAQPLPPRELTFMDEIRARLRWQYLRQERDQPDDPDQPDEPAA
jgi:Domain of unknown function (DUF222)